MADAFGSTANEVRCPSCGTSVGPAMLACPSCHAFIHAAALRELSATATRAEAEGDRTAALTEWRRALDLLPPATRQHREVNDRVTRLSSELAASGGSVAPAAKKAPPKWLAGFGVFGMFLWKFWGILLLVATKAKFLLLGFSKLGTVLTMLASFGVYWSLWGWKFAAGFILSIYVHEMGHVASLRRFGLPASAPMFIPGLGAFVRLKARPTSLVEDAHIGLAGPWWGLGASLASVGLYYATGLPIFLAIGTVSANINLFNLLPLGTLDGGRGLQPIARNGRLILAAVGVAVGLALGAPMAIGVGAIAGFRAFSKQAPRTGHQPTVVAFAVLIVALALVSAIPVPTGARV